MYYVDSHSGNSGGWVGSNVSIPKSATLVGFYFFSDTANAINEGAYIDNVVLSGYETVSIDIWTNKHAYTIGETMIVYLRVSNLGPATPVRAIIKLQLPNGNWYGPLLDMTTTLPAGFDSGTYLWNSFKIPTAPLGTYKWLAELRKSATNALIDSDIYIWTLT
jgi:hypothetical protein